MWAYDLGIRGMCVLECTGVFLYMECEVSVLVRLECGSEDS